MFQGIVTEYAIEFLNLTFIQLDSFDNIDIIVKSTENINSCPYCSNIERYGLPSFHILHTSTKRNFLLKFIHTRWLTSTLIKCYDIKYDIFPPVIKDMTMEKTNLENTLQENIKKRKIVNLPKPTSFHTFGSTLEVFKEIADRSITQYSDNHINKLYKSNELLLGYISEDNKEDSFNEIIEDLSQVITKKIHSPVSTRFNNEENVRDSFGLICQSNINQKLLPTPNKTKTYYGTNHFKTELILEKLTK